MASELGKSPLFKITNPQSIVFFGVSNRLSAMGTIIFQAFISDGYQGTFFLVHPQETSIMGFRAYKQVDDIEGIPDLAVIILPTPIVIDTLEAIGKKGIKHAIIVSAGFKEMGGEGISREKKLVETALKYGIRFIGPNCIGVINPHIRFNITYFRMEENPGNIGLASQSGSFINQMHNYLKRVNQGFSTAFSIGNSANIDLVDCLEYFGECPHTKVIGLYIEGIERGRAFVEMAKKIAIKKPIVAFYTGGSDAGRKATLSHTGTLAGPDRLYDGMFRQCGVIRARSIIELFDMCRALSSLPIPRGNSIAIQTNSGGPGASAADTCGKEGLDVPDLSPETVTKLSPYVPHTGSIKNPVDITYSKDPLDFYGPIPEALMAGPEIDGLLTYYLVPDELFTALPKQLGAPDTEVVEKGAALFEGFAKTAAALIKKHDKPMAGFVLRSLDEKFPQLLMRHGVPVFFGPERAVRAIKALFIYNKFRQRLLLEKKEDLP